MLLKNIFDNSWFDENGISEVQQEESYFYLLWSVINRYYPIYCYIFIYNLYI